MSYLSLALGIGLIFAIAAVPLWILDRVQAKRQNGSESHSQRRVDQFIDIVCYLIVGSITVFCIYAIFKHLGPDKFAFMSGVIVAISVVAFLITRRWFWILVFGLGGLAAVLTMLAFVFQFQIFAAVCMLLLASFLLGMARVISSP